MIGVEAIARDVVDLSMRLHRTLGPGLLESVYETVLAGKLAAAGYKVSRRRAIDIEFEGMRFEAAFRIDLLIEIKSVERLNGAHMKQLLTYLRLTDRSLGLLINFGGETLKEGLRRVVNNHPAFAPSRLCVNPPSSGEY